MKKIIHLFGMSNTGKSTLAQALAERLSHLNVEIIDADVYRKTINSDLGFSKEDRIENVRRLQLIAENSNSNIIIICATSPYIETRKENNINIFLRADLDILLKRDSEKQIYKYSNVAGIDFPFESPQEVPHLQLNTGITSIEECVDKIINYANLKPKYDLFIGRWQTLHEGHDWLFDQKLKEKKNILIAIRDVSLSDKDKLTAHEVEENIKERYKDLILLGKIKTMIIPDIASINYGRDVGYEVIEHTPPTEIKEISGTLIRSKLNS